MIIITDCKTADLKSSTNISGVQNNLKSLLQNIMLSKNDKFALKAERSFS